MCRNGMPHHLVSINGTCFTDRRFEDFYKKLDIVQMFSSMEHPQTNGIAEATNKIFIIGSKKKLEQAKGLWGDELPTMLWAYHITPRKHLTS